MREVNEYPMRPSATSVPMREVNEISPMRYSSVSYETSSLRPMRLVAYRPMREVNEIAHLRPSI
jgi:RIO-like serine/threonine protein kinase